MFRYEHSLNADATPEAIFALYSDIATWPSWDDAIAAMTLDGPFAVGVSGTLSLVNGPTLPFMLAAVTPGCGFADETPLPRGAIRFEHALEPLAHGRTRITHRVQIDGPAADELGPHLTAGIPRTVAALAALAAATAAGSASRVPR